MFGYSLQEETEFLLSRRRMAVEDFKCFRNSIVDGDYQADELSLGVPWAVVQH